MGTRREAATHFAQYLCATQMISEKEHCIGKQKLIDIFSQMYQPEYSVQCLEVNNLIPALAKAGLLDKPKTTKPNPDINFNWSNVQKHGLQEGQYPDKLPEKFSKPIQRVVVNPRYSERGSLQLPDVVSDVGCAICKTKLTPSTVEEHKSDELHILRTLYRKGRKEFDAGKRFMEAKILNNESGADASLKMSCRVGIKYEIVIEFKNFHESQPLSIERVFELMHHKDVKVEEMKQPVKIMPGETFSLEVKVKFSARNAVLCPLVLKLLPAEGGRCVYFLKDLVFLIQSEVMDALAPTAPYRSSLGPILRLEDAPILPGKPLDSKKSDLDYTSKLKLLKFEIPYLLLRFLNRGFKPDKNMTPLEKKKLDEIWSILPQNGNSLAKESYAQFLELLLFIEEHQMNQDIHHYDMRDAVLRRTGRDLWLKVPGLVDKRPSLLINDVILANFVDDRSKTYEGYVHKIVDGEVMLGFHDTFVKTYNAQKLEIRFKINRNALKSMHRALYIIRSHQAETLLFPETKSRPNHQPPLKPWFNPSIEKNPEQQAAVRNIVYKSSQNSPYLVFGPPGTGKTVTMVETIMQLWDPIHKRSRILVCAPSNSAADEITKRLLPMIRLQVKEPKNHLLRMYAMSRTLDSLPMIIREYEVSNHDPRDGLVDYPRKEVLMTYDIVICTFSTSSRLVLAGIPPGHFTHTLMDEVGQALEPEALIPLAGLATSADKPGQFLSQVVMAGDPKQLGPILQSDTAAKYGLDKSMLERLMAMPLYSKQYETAKYDPNVLTKLVLNYRSHPSLLEVSNNLFYDGELKAVGDPNVIEQACNWQALKKKGFPLIFHGVEGIDEREGNSPSFFNRQEIEVVTDYVRKLLDDGVAFGKDIGIVTPYNMQVKKMKRACDLLGLHNIDVGSVEQFQGQERKVILISTVRSRHQFVEFDYLFQLGFLKNPKRFNVAVTRARALLIVVGNPNVLQHDSCWKALIKHCMKNDAYVGIPFEFSTEELTQEQIPLDTKRIQI